MDPVKVSLFASKIAELRNHFVFSVTSWIRSPERNADVGGLPTSKHLTGLGIDIVPEDPHQKNDLFALIKTLGLHFLDEGDHIHIQD